MTLVKMQADYLLKKAAYDKAFESEDWEKVDELEDPYLESEFALFDKVGEILIATGKISKEDIELVRRNSNLGQWKKLIDMALLLQA